MSDPVEIVAKHVRALRYAERGQAVGPRITVEDREIARDILDELVTAPSRWRVIRLDHQCSLTIKEHEELEHHIAEEYRP